MAYLMLNLSGSTGEPIPASYDASFTFFVACIISEPLEAILHNFKVLQPGMYLAFQTGKALFWSIYLPIAIVDPADGKKDTIWLILVLVVVLATLSHYASLIYAVVVFRRWRNTHRLDRIVRFYATRRSSDHEDEKIWDSHPSRPPSYDDSSRASNHASHWSCDTHSTHESSLSISKPVHPASPVLG